MKTYLCSILVYGEGLYSDIWIDSHHKHDSNQVITSIMNVINDVRDPRGGLLPSVLHIQVDNCSRKNKNQYMFTFCAALVGLGYFMKVYLSFLLVGHIHEDIDQRISVISSQIFDGVPLPRPVLCYAKCLHADLLARAPKSQCSPS